MENEVQSTSSISINSQILDSMSIGLTIRTTTTDDVENVVLEFSEIQQFRGTNLCRTPSQTVGCNSGQTTFYKI